MYDKYVEKGKATVVSPPVQAAPHVYALVALLLSLVPCALARGTESVEVRVGYLGPRETPAERGVQLGIEEANVQGRFTGRSFRLQLLSELGEVSPAFAAVVAAVPAEVLVEAAGRGVAVLNIAAADDALRSACHPDLLHVLPSLRMQSDARAQWREKRPTSAASAETWHRDFVRFAARDLNKRYSRRFDERMDGSAWAGWAAVKAVAETVTRGGEGGAASVARYLRTQLEFDGQKGVALSFRATGQLRQPLLLVEGDQIVGQAPVRGVSGAGDLDSLGASTCPAAATSPADRKQETAP